MPRCCLIRGRRKRENVDIGLAASYMPHQDYAANAEYSCEYEHGKLAAEHSLRISGKHGNWTWLQVSREQVKNTDLVNKAAQSSASSCL